MNKKDAIIQTLAQRVLDAERYIYEASLDFDGKSNYVPDKTIEEIIKKAEAVCVTSYKIVGRYPLSSSDAPSWMCGVKPGTIAKKRVYASKEDYDRYGPDLAMRWRKFCHYDVECYKMVGGEWVLLGAGEMPGK